MISAAGSVSGISGSYKRAGTGRRSYQIALGNHKFSQTCNSIYIYKHEWDTCCSLYYTARTSKHVTQAQKKQVDIYNIWPFRLNSEDGLSGCFRSCLRGNLAGWDVWTPDLTSVGKILHKYIYIYIYIAPTKIMFGNAEYIYNQSEHPKMAHTAPPWWSQQQDLSLASRAPTRERALVGDRTKLLLETTSSHKRATL